MTIEELEDNHGEIHEGFDGYIEQHTNLSIQFAIEVLEECINYNKHHIDNSCQDNVEDKIQELKQYLDGN